MAKILKAVTFSSAGRERKHGVQPVQSLDGSLFVHAENYGIGGRFEVKANHVSCLFSKIRIVTGHVSAQLMRLEPGLGPGARHAHMTDPQLRCQFACAPVSRPIRWSSPCIIQNAGLQIWSLQLDFSPEVSSIESGQTIGHKPFPPKPDRIYTAP